MNKIYLTESQAIRRLMKRYMVDHLYMLTAVGQYLDLLLEHHCWQDNLSQAQLAKYTIR